jgi:hypothetical protein
VAVLPRHTFNTNRGDARGGGGNPELSVNSAETASGCLPAHANTADMGSNAFNTNRGDAMVGRGSLHLRPDPAEIAPGLPSPPAAAAADEPLSYPKPNGDSLEILAYPNLNPNPSETASQLPWLPWAELRLSLPPRGGCVCVGATPDGAVLTRSPACHAFAAAPGLPDTARAYPSGDTTLPAVAALGTSVCVCVGATPDAALLTPPSPASAAAHTTSRLPDPAHTYPSVGTAVAPVTPPPRGGCVCVSETPDDAVLTRSPAGHSFAAVPGTSRLPDTAIAQLSGDAALAASRLFQRDTPQEHADPGDQPLVASALGYIPGGSSCRPPCSRRQRGFPRECEACEAAGARCEFIFHAAGRPFVLVPGDERNGSRRGSMSKREALCVMLRHAGLGHLLLPAEREGGCGGGPNDTGGGPRGGAGGEHEQAGGAVRHAETCGACPFDDTARAEGGWRRRAK